MSETRPEASRDAGYRYYLALAIAAVAVFLIAAPHRVTMYALGCDSFGYMRQAQLFRTLDPVSALDTRIGDKDSLFLIDVARSVTPDWRRWGEAVAPHCHHYDAGSDHVILQYPPGTGFILSFFSPERGLGRIAAISGLLIAVSFLVAAAPFRLSPFTASAGIASLGVLFWALVHPQALGSASIPASLGLIPVCVLLTVAAFPGGGGKPRPEWALALGVACGLLFAVRLPNAILLVGLAVAILVNEWPLRPRQHLPALAAGLAGFVLAGALPVLGANWINTGSAFATTYSSIDASPRIFSVPALTERIEHYFTHRLAGPPLIAASALLASRLMTLGDLRSDRGRHGLAIGAGVALVLSLAFFGTHQIKNSYYMVPASALAIVMVCFELFGSGSRLPPSRRYAWLVVASIGAVAVAAGIAFGDTAKRRHPNTIPDEVLAPDVIVWGDLATSTLYHYRGKYAAKLAFVGQCMQQRLVEAVHERGRDQYFLADSDNARRMIARLGAFAPMTEIGMFDTFNKVPVWRLAADAPFVAPPCD